MKGAEKVLYEEVIFFSLLHRELEKGKMLSTVNVREG